MSIGFLLAVPYVFAQVDTATIAGVVSDKTEARIPDARVVLQEVNTGVQQTGSTNKAGLFNFDGVHPGQYRLHVSKNGFADTSINGITINVGDNRSLDIKLKVGPTTQKVDVDADGLTLNTTDASVSTVIDRKFVENIPLNGRSFQDLISMTPGVVTQSPQSNGGPTSLGYSGDFSVNGQRTESNYYTVDGVSGNFGAGNGYATAQAATGGSTPASTALGTTQSLTSVDALQEFRIEGSTYSAEYGRSPGGQFAFLTRSGTNTVHGSLFDYLRNDFFDANDWFNNHYGKPIGALRQNDFGGTVGGPIPLPKFYGARRKMFFFLSYEGLRLTQPQAASILYVPDAYLRQQAPAPLRPILNAYPLPTPGGIDYGTSTSPSLAQFIQPYSVPSQINSTSVRMDHTLDQHLALFFRYSNTPSFSESRSLSSLLKKDFSSQEYTVGATSRLSSRAVDEFRLGYAAATSAIRTTLDNFSGAIPIDLNSALGAGPSPYADSYFYLYFAPIGTAPLQAQQTSNQNNVWNVVDTLSFPAGNHVIKAGFDYRLIKSSLNPYMPLVEPIFFGAADVLKNSPTETFVNKPLAATPIFNQFAAFGQDQWKVNATLTLSLGLRWEVNPPPTGANGNDAYTTTGSIAIPSTLALAPRGTPLWNTSWWNFAPRIGASWQMHNNPGRETILRTGGGVFFDTNDQIASVGFGGTAVGFSAYKYFFGVPVPVTAAQLAFSPSAEPPYTTSSVYAFPKQLQLPYVLQWNVSLEQALGQTQSLTISYVGSNGRRQLGEQQLSLAKFNPNFGTVYSFYGGITSNYQSLQGKFQRSIAHGLQVLTSYTWSHSIDFGSTYATLPVTRGDSNYDVRNNLSVALSWDTPGSHLNRAVDMLVNNWGLDARVSARTAFPITLLGNLLTDSSGNQYYGGVNVVPNRPTYIYGSQYPGGRSVNRSAFSVPPVSTLGNAPRNFVRGFGAVQSNVAVRRAFHLHDNVALQFRAESFNILNHPNFGYVDPTLSNATFGQATNMLNQSLGTVAAQYQQGGSRSLQFALKLVF